MTAHARSFRFIFCIVFLLGNSSAGFSSALRPFDNIFTSDGELEFGAEYRGQTLRIIVIGAGGGGSSSITAPFLTRTGAGGGSGAIVYSEIKIARPIKVSWILGKGGLGGTLPPPPVFDRNGRDGGMTEVKTSYGHSIVAMGGLGARDIPSADIDGVRFLNPVPPLGGDGGIPWGISGADGNPSLRVNPGQYILGGSGGRIAGVDQGGFGGAGGGTHTQVCCGGEEPGTAGANGTVRLQILVSRPEYLSKQTAPSRADAAPDAEISFEKFLKIASSECQSQGDKCPAPIKKNLLRIQRDRTLSFHSKLALIFGDAHAKPRAMASDVIGAWAYTTLLSFMAPPMRAIATFVNLIPGDSRNIEIVPPPVQNPNLAAMSEAELNELYGSAIVATLWMQNTFPANAANQSAINALADYSNAIKEEIVLRQRIAQGNKAASQARGKVPGVGVDGPNMPRPVTSGEIRGGIGNRCLRCGSVIVGHKTLGTDCIVILCP